MKSRRLPNWHWPPADGDRRKIESWPKMNFQNPIPTVFLESRPPHISTTSGYEKIVPQITECHSSERFDSTLSLLLVIGRCCARFATHTRPFLPVCFANVYLNHGWYNPPPANANRHRKKPMAELQTRNSSPANCSVGIMFGNHCRHQRAKRDRQDVCRCGHLMALGFSSFSADLDPA